MTQDGLEKDLLHCNEQCRLDEAEREWVHTARKYIDTKHLPMLGKILRLFDDVSLTISRWILLAILVGGMALVFAFFGWKFRG